jgi:hypothetical protein
MDTGLILLISKWLRRLLCGGLLSFLLFSCASQREKNLLPSDSEIEKNLDSIAETRTKVQNFGPSITEGENLFRDKTQAYGLEGVEGVNFVLIDLNRDMIEDLIVVPSFFSEPVVYLFDVSQKKFIKSTHSLFSEPVQLSFLLLADFNNDKVQDAVVGVLNQRGEFSKIPVSLWRGSWSAENLLTFTRDQSFPKIEPEPTSTIVTLDINLDGRLDLFIGNWFHENKQNLLPTADRLLVNQVDKWVDETRLLEGEAVKSSDDIFPPLAKPTYGASSCDIDQDGWPDILTASASGHYNKLWMNRPRAGSKERRFVDVGKVSGFAADPNGILVPTSGGRTFSAVCADYNDDGVMDIFLGELTHGWDNLSVDRSSVLTGNSVTYPPSFLRTEYMSDTVEENWNQGDKRALWADMNLDGRVDLVVDNSGFPPNSRLVLFAQDETRSFVNVAHQWGADVVNPTGTVLGDFNRDGKLDILTAQTNIRNANMKNRLYLLENDLSTTGRSVRFYLEGKVANAQGLGSMLMLYSQSISKKTIQRRWYELSQGGTPSQLPKGVHFGVEASSEVLGVKVRWPTLGAKDLLNSKPIERLYKIKDNKSKPYQEFTLCEDGRILEGRFSCL